MASEWPDGRDIQLHDRMFHYRPINGDIRLVTLERGDGKDAVRCKMFDVEFSTELVYVALSYEWGRVGEGSIIWIDGGFRKIGSSLFNALMHLRRPNEDLILWVDALCIDQQNLGERNHQVELMGKIYSQAAEVVIWLGLARDDSRLAMAQFRAISENLSLGKPVGRPVMHIEAVLSWVRRTYWRRMWVIQEIQLAKDLSICCGTERIKWSEFARTRQWVLSWPERFRSEIEVYNEMTVSLPARMDEIRVQGRARRRDIPLIDWLEIFEKSLCTDPKDKVYAVVGLARDCQKGELAVDYSKSLSQIFFDLLKHYMQRDVSNPGQSTTDTANLLFLSRCLFKWLQMDSSGAIDEMKERIWVLGTYCGSIAILGPEYQVSPTRASQLQVGYRNKPVSISSMSISSVSAVSSSNSIANMATRPERIFNAIIGSVFREAKVPSSLRGENKMIESGTQLLPLGDEYWSMPGDLVEKTVGLRTAITTQGETILVPPSTHHDDMICILPGCNIALVFRKFNQWTLEGLAVHSMARRPPTHIEAVHVYLDILSLQKITVAAQFAPAYQLNVAWWHQQ
jgi:hypothetical protein